MIVNNVYMPNEILSNILTYTSPSSLLVCKAFYANFFAAFLNNFHNNLHLRDIKQIYTDVSDEEKIRCFYNTVVKSVKDNYSESNFYKFEEKIQNVFVQKTFSISELNQLDSCLEDISLFRLFRVIAFHLSADNDLSARNFYYEMEGKNIFENVQKIRAWMRDNQEKLKAIKTLNLAKDTTFQLVKLPKEIGLLTELEKVNLYNNQLKNLPTEIGLLSKLKDLSLQNNQLITLPAEIGLLSELEELVLEGNSTLKNLPAEMKKLNKLQKLNLYAIALPAKTIEELKQQLPNCNVITYEPMLLN